MTRSIYVIKELLRNVYRNPGTALGSLLSLTLLFLLFNLFWVAAGTAERFYVTLISDLKMDVFLSEELPDSSIAGLTKEIASIDGVDSISFISKDMARQELAARVGTDLLVGYDTLNPLPRSFVLTFKPRFLNMSDLSDIEDKLAVLPGVAEINYSRHWLEKVEETKGVIFRIGLALGVIILLTALISSANNIRLMTRARAVGFRQMLLLGASRWFVAAPFLIEGVLMAGLAAVAGWLIVAYGQGQIAFTQFDIVMPVRQDIIIFCLACAALGLVSGYLGIRRQMKV
jgi:cell division transport system permease protein